MRRLSLLAPITCLVVVLFVHTILTLASDSPANESFVRTSAPSSHTLVTPTTTPNGHMFTDSATVALATTALDRGQLLNHLDRKPEAQASSSDWPQVQRDPQRTGYTPEVLGTNFQVAWTHPFQPERVYPQVQAIVYQGKVFVGTEMGNMYALDAQTGAKVWQFTAGGPILASVAAANGKVFFGCMDGAVYALDVNSGNQVWKRQLSPNLGFSTAPVFADNKVMLGGRDGIFYALDPNNGNILWQYDEIGWPILQTAAWDNGKVFFGAMDMHVYALDSADGSLAWKSEKLYGRAFKDYWPVVTQGKVIIRPTGGNHNYDLKVVGFPFKWMMGVGTEEEWDWYMENGPTVAAGQLTSIPDVMNAQDEAMAKYEANPDSYSYNMNVLDANTGQEAFLVPHWNKQVLTGTIVPPCVDRDGKLIVPLTYMHCGWGRLDLTSRRIVDLLYDHTDRQGNPLQSGGTPAGFGNGDENYNVSCSGNMVFAFHCWEHTGSPYTGGFDLDSRRWTNFPRAMTSWQMHTNTQGGGGNPASIADGMIYHIAIHELIARSTQ